MRDLADGIPFDVSDNDTKIMMREQDMNPVLLRALTSEERELLLVLQERWTQFCREARDWPVIQQCAERGFLNGLIVALNVMCTSIDAKVQLNMWEQKLSYGRTKTPW